MPQQRAFVALPLFALALAATTAWGQSATQVFERTSPSVVVVYALDKAGKPASQGSGVVIARGVIATNCHVLEDGVSYAVEHNTRRHPAKLSHADWDRDVCSLSADGVTAPAVPLGSTRQLKVGQKVYAVGAPKGLELTLSEGIISSLREMGEGSRHLQIAHLPRLQRRWPVRRRRAADRPAHLLPRRGAATQLRRAGGVRAATAATGRKSDSQT